MNKQDEKEIKKIQTRAYAKFGPRLYKKEKKADAILDVIDKCLKEERHRFDEDTLEKLQAIKDSKMLDGEQKVINEAVAQEMEIEVEKQIGIAIRDGRISPPEGLKDKK